MNKKHNPDKIERCRTNLRYDNVSSVEEHMWNVFSTGHNGIIHAFGSCSIVGLLQAQSKIGAPQVIARR